MKEKIVYFLLGSLLLFPLNAKAQHYKGEEPQVTYQSYRTNGIGDNLFVGIAGGANIYIGECDKEASIFKRLSPALDISVGKWITPDYGIRLQYAGLKAKGLTEEGAIYADGYNGKYYKKKFNVLNLHADFLWNCTNQFKGYNKNRMWNLIPFAGFGWGHSSGNNKSKDEIAASFGLLTTYRIDDNINLTLEARQMIVNERFDGVTGESEGEGMTSITIGVIYKFGKTDFETYKQIPADFSSYNNKINELRRQNEELTSDNKSLKSALESWKNKKVENITKDKMSTSPIALFFDLGKATLDEKELVNLDFYVYHALNIDKDKVFTLTGSADKGTGTRTQNLKLSEERVEYVESLLINRYGISKDRLIRQAQGDTNNTFDSAGLNRVVIIK
jgi:outer membrane protein OmpA-like peptidoglycan-associated protein